MLRYLRGGGAGLSFIEYGTPGGVHLTTPGDVLGLAFRPSTHHLGTPPGDQVTYRWSLDTGLSLEQTKDGLRAGDVYIASAADFVAEAVLPVNGLSDAAKLGVRAASILLDIGPIAPLTFPALSWTVPRIRRSSMPSPAHLSCTWNGTFDSPQGIEEIWSFGLNCVMPAADQTGPALTAVADQLHLAYTQTLGTRQAGAVVLREARVARVDPAGKWERYADGAYKVGRWLGNLPATGPGVVRFPLQAALCISLGTARPGATGRGRFFVPWQGVALSERFTLSTDSQNSWATGAKDFLHAVTAAAGSVVVMSRANPLKGRPDGYTSTVTNVRVGAVVDTMRSRRNAQIESYMQQAI